MTERPGEIPFRLRIALPVSLILNLFLVALVVGHALNTRSRNDVVGTSLARSISRAEALLPPKDAAAFGSIMRRDAAQYTQAAQQLNDARRELNRQLVAEPFDPEAARRALKGAETAWSHFLDDFSGTLIDGLAQVSPEGRRKLVSQTPFSLDAKASGKAH